MKDEIKINQGKIFYFPKLNKKNYYILIFVICSLFRRLFPFLIESSDFGKVDEENFNKVYMLLKNNNFYFIDDIILNYLELFEIEEEYVQLAITDIKSVLGDNFVEQIGKNMTFINKIIELAISYSNKHI